MGRLKRIWPSEDGERILPAGRFAPTFTQHRQDGGGGGGRMLWSDKQGGAGAHTSDPPSDQGPESGLHDEPDSSSHQGVPGVPGVPGLPIIPSLSAPGTLEVSQSWGVLSAANVHHVCTAFNGRQCCTSVLDHFTTQQTTLMIKCKQAAGRIHHERSSTKPPTETSSRYRSEQIALSYL